LDYILDSYAWIEYTLGSQKGLVVRKIINNQKNRLITLHSSLAELYQWCLREGKSFEQMITIVKTFSSIEPINLRLWLEAAKIRNEKKSAIKDFGLMDAIMLTKQNETGWKIITGDKHFRNLKGVVFLK